MSKNIAKEIEVLQQRIDNKKNIEEINNIQKYLIKKINNARYEYTTMNKQEHTDFLLDLALNWIIYEMEKRKIR